MLSMAEGPRLFGDQGGGGTKMATKVGRGVETGRLYGGFTVALLVLSQKINPPKNYIPSRSLT